jgi:hypothetical protein
MPDAFLLVVDGQELQLRATARTLDKARYRTLRGRTGQETLQVTRQERPDPNVVVANGGSIAVEREGVADRGSTFTVALPRTGGTG